MADEELTTTDPSKLDSTVDNIVERLLRAGIDGLGKFSSAQSVADEALAEYSDPEEAINAIVKQHVLLAASSGFVTALGGFVTLPIALPANVLGFYILATRMAGAIAAIHGHDLRDNAVRSSVLLALTGEDATEIVRKAGGGAVAGRATTWALGSLPPSALMAVNKGVAFRIGIKLTERGLSRLGRFVPLAGGMIGGSVDAYAMHRIAKHARATLVPHPKELTADGE